MTALSVNLNKIALLRNQRHGSHPDLTRAVSVIFKAGASGVTVHPRPDERHIRYDDVTMVSALLTREYPDAFEFNIEGYPSDEFLALVEKARPTQITLVPDKPDQLTSDHGWSPDETASQLPEIIQTLKARGGRVSLFTDANNAAIDAAKIAGADRIELYTGPFRDGFAEPGRRQDTLNTYRTAAEHAHGLGLGVNAGHDLTLDNLGALCRAIPWLAEVSIGHALTADALHMGLSAAVTAYRATIEEARG